MTFIILFCWQVKNGVRQGILKGLGIICIGVNIVVDTCNYSLGNSSVSGVKQKYVFNDLDQ